MTSERPILFSAPLICAILEGRKTETRRLVTMRESLGPAVVWCHGDGDGVTAISGARAAWEELDFSGGWVDRGWAAPRPGPVPAT